MTCAGTVAGLWLVDIDDAQLPAKVFVIGADGNRHRGELVFAGGRYVVQLKTPIRYPAGCPVLVTPRVLP